MVCTCLHAIVSCYTDGPVMVDLSHTSDQTVRDAIAISRAPVIWSHSGSRAINNHARNVPDDLLELIGDGPGKKPGIM